jgi:hypothetical protein
MMPNVAQYALYMATFVAIERAVHIEHNMHSMVYQYSDSAH